MITTTDFYTCFVFVCTSSDDRDLTPSLPWCHLKTTSNSEKFQTLKPFCFLFFALARERTFIKTHSIESRWVIGPENITVCGCLDPYIFQPGNFTGLGSEGVNDENQKTRRMLWLLCMFSVAAYTITGEQQQQQEKKKKKKKRKKKKKNVAVSRAVWARMDLCFVMHRRVPMHIDIGEAT